jgi:hypothetical protein
MYIVISIPNRKSIARGVSHFITISYFYFTVKPKTEASEALHAIPFPLRRGDQWSGTRHTTPATRGRNKVAQL